MQLNKIASTIIMALMWTGVAWSADNYVIDPVHSTVGFAVRHLVISNVKGKFKEFSGTIAYDPQDITKSSVAVTIKAASIDTGDDDRDKHLRSADFLAADQYPEIKFVSKRIQKKGSGYVCVGDLTIRGVTREVAIPFKITGTIKDPWGNTRLGAEGSLSINRQHYGVSWNRNLDAGGVVVGDTVNIELIVEAIKKK